MNIWTIIYGLNYWIQSQQYKITPDIHTFLESGYVVLSKYLIEIENKAFGQELSIIVTTNIESSKMYHELILKLIIDFI